MASGTRPATECIGDDDTLSLLTLTILNYFNEAFVDQTAWQHVYNIIIIIHGTEPHAIATYSEEVTHTILCYIIICTFQSTHCMSQQKYDWCSYS